MTQNIKEQYQDKAQEVLERRPKDALIHSPHVSGDSEGSGVRIPSLEDTSHHKSCQNPKKRFISKEVLDNFWETTDNASYAKKVIASGRKITTEPEPIHYPKRTTDNASCPKSWFNGWKEGVKSVFVFLRDMGKINQSSKMEEEYNDWEKADEYTKFNGEVVKRYE